MNYDPKNIKKELYETALITTGAVAVGIATRTIVGKQLGTPETLKGALKMGFAVGVGTLLIKFLQSKKWIPVSPPA